MSVRPRFRSLSDSRSRSRSRAGSTQVGDQDESNSSDRRSRSRSPAPTNSSRNFVHPLPGVQDKASETFGSLKSRSTSSVGRVEPRTAVTAVFQQAHLDPDSPGEFAIRHHFGNLIVKLDEYRPGRVQCILEALKAKLPCRKTPEQIERPGDDMRFRISFAEVQRLRIRKLQCELVRHVVKMRLDGHESAGWENALKEYSKVNLFQPSSHPSHFQHPVEWVHARRRD